MRVERNGTVRTAFAVGQDASGSGEAATAVAVQPDGSYAISGQAAAPPATTTHGSPSSLPPTSCGGRRPTSTGRPVSSPATTGWPPGSPGSTAATS